MDARRPNATGWTRTSRASRPGGLARTIGGACDEIDEIDDFLTLIGLAILWERNTPV